LCQNRMFRPMDRRGFGAGFRHGIKLPAPPEYPLLPFICVFGILNTTRSSEVFAMRPFRRLFSSQGVMSHGKESGY
jgi:hypothetical protein